MFSTEEFIIALFCCVDDALKPLLEAHPIEFPRGFAPHLTPAEVITMELVGEYRGIDTDKGVWQYFRAHWHSLDLLHNWFHDMVLTLMTSLLWTISDELRNSPKPQFKRL